MRKTITILILVVIALSLTSCNYKLVDTKFQFDYAIIRLPNGEVIEGKIVQWTDYEDGEQLQLVLDDGNTYLVSSFYTTLISYGSGMDERSEDG